MAGMRWLSWIRDTYLDRMASKYSGALVDREHAKFREFRGLSGRTVVSVGDDEGQPLMASTEDVLGEVLDELRAIRLGIEILVDQPLRKEDAA